MKNNNEINNIKKSDEILNKAYLADTDSKAKKYAKEALNLNPNNIEAKLFLTDFEDNVIKKLDLVNNIVNQEEEKLKNNGYLLNKNIGDLELIDETKNYMIARDTQIIILKNLNRYSEAIENCKEMLKLSKNDTLGIRYTLLELYCLLEKKDDFNKLLQNYDDKTEEIMLIKAIAYYKNAEYDLSKATIKELKKSNPFIIHFILDYEPTSFNEYISPKFLDEDNLDYYIDRALNTVIDLNHLISSVPYFNEFLSSNYKKCY